MKRLLIIVLMLAVAGGLAGCERESAAEKLDRLWAKAEVASAHSGCLEYQVYRGMRGEILPDFNKKLYKPLKDEDTGKVCVTIDAPLAASPATLRKFIRAYTDENYQEADALIKQGLVMRLGPGQSIVFLARIPVHAVYKVRPPNGLQEFYVPTWAIYPK